MGLALKGAPSSRGNVSLAELADPGALPADWIRSHARDVRNIWNPWSTAMSDRSECDFDAASFERGVAMVTAETAGQPVLDLTGIGQGFRARSGPLHDVDMQVFPGRGGRP